MCVRWQVGDQETLPFFSVLTEAAVHIPRSEPRQRIPWRRRRGSHCADAPATCCSAQVKLLELGRVASGPGDVLNIIRVVVLCLQCFLW